MLSRAQLQVPDAAVLKVLMTVAAVPPGVPLEMEAYVSAALDLV